MDGKKNMNISLSFLSLKNAYFSSPFFSSSSELSLNINKIQINKMISNFVYSNNFQNRKLSIKQSKFIKSLSSAVYLSQLQTFSKYNLYKNNENHVEIEESQFIQCKTTEAKQINGGSLHLENVKNISIVKCSFLLCSAIKDQNEKGGAVFISGDTEKLFLRDNCFSQCSTSTNGSAVYASLNTLSTSKSINQFNMTSIHRCPYFLKKNQHASIFLNARRLFTSDFNISECHSLHSPAFSYNTSTFSQHFHYTILNQTGGKRFVLFDFESHSERIEKSLFNKWNIIFEEPKNRMVFDVVKHSVSNMIFYGGEFDYTIQLLNGEIQFSFVRSDKRIKVSREDEKSPMVIDKFTFDKDSIKFIKLDHVKDNQCKLVFKLPEDKSQISFIYLIAPVIVILLGLSFTLSVSLIIKKLGESPAEREDEQILRKKPRAIK